MAGKDAQPLPAVRVRRAVAEDAAGLSLLGRGTFLESYAHVLPATDIIAHAERQHAPEVYARWLADPHCHCFIAEVEPGAAPVAYLVATVPDLPLDGVDDRDLEIRRIYVLHRFQGLGLGRQLMTLVDAAARAAGKRRLLLGVFSRNAAALSFYSSQGFTQVGTREFRVGANTYHDYILERPT
jgi:ribosomal protein S18 acetylase RimI-like enzyme